MANYIPIDEANPVDRFETSTAKNTTPAVVVMAVHTTSSANERRNNTVRGGKICGRRIETALEPENGVCLIDLPGRDTQLEETEDFLYSFDTLFTNVSAMRSIILAHALDLVLGLLAQLLSSVHIGLDLTQPPCVDSGVSRQLGVEAGPEHIALTNSHDVAHLLIGINITTLSGAPSGGSGQGGQHLDMIRCSSFCYRALRLPGGSSDGVFTLRLLHLNSFLMRQDTFYNGGSNEDRWERRGVLAQEWQLQRPLETLGLTAKVVTVDSNVEATDELLATLLCLVG